MFNFEVEVCENTSVKFNLNGYISGDTTVIYGQMKVTGDGLQSVAGCSILSPHDVGERDMVVGIKQAFKNMMKGRFTEKINRKVYSHFRKLLREKGVISVTPSTEKVILLW